MMRSRGLTLEQCLSGVGEGWHKIVRRLFDAARERGYRPVQVKEKFGALRFYVEAVGPTKEADIGLFSIIDEGEVESTKTCEVCGEPGEPRSGGWLKTLCAVHAANRAILGSPGD